MKSERLLSLDIFRGFTVIAMLLVDYPGTWETRFSIFNHAQWNGFNAPDFIFPSFLFIMGVAMAFSLGKKMDKATNKLPLIRNIIIRTAILFILGYMVNIFFHSEEYNINTIRLLGVLQRIAIVYLVASLLMLHLNKKQLIITGISILAGYWAIMKLIPIPGFGMPNLYIEPGNIVANLSAWIDMQVLGNLAWEYSMPYDPEGILSTIPCITTTIIGIITGYWLRGENTIEKKTIGLYMAGICFIVVGLIWNNWFPINKKIWSGSFVAYAAGWSLVVFASFYWIIDGVKKNFKVLTIFRVFGMNALASFFLFAFVTFLLNIIPIGQGTLMDFIFNKLLTSWLPVIHASWIFSVFYLIFWSLIFWFLDKKKIYIKL